MKTRVSMVMPDYGEVIVEPFGLMFGMMLEDEEQTGLMVSSDASDEPEVVMYLPLPVVEAIVGAYHAYRNQLEGQDD